MAAATQPAMDNAPKTVLVIGASFSGLELIKYLDGYCNIIVIDRKDYWEIAPKFLPAFAGISVYEEGVGMYRPLLAQHRNLTFIHGDVISLEKRQATIQPFPELQKGEAEKPLPPHQTIAFDYAVVCTGFTYGTNIFKPGENDHYFWKRRETVYAEKRKLEAAKTVLIEGGGAVGVELAAFIAEHDRQANLPPKQVVLAVKGDRILDVSPAPVSLEVLEKLREAHIEVVFGANTHQMKADRQFDVTYQAYGVRCNANFLKTELAGCKLPSGEISVNSLFQLTDANGIAYPSVFAIGDICVPSGLPDPKVVSAPRAHAEYLGENLAALCGKRSFWSKLCCGCGSGNAPPTLKHYPTNRADRPGMYGMLMVPPTGVLMNNNEASVSRMYLSIKKMINNMLTKQVAGARPPPQ